MQAARRLDLQAARRLDVQAARRLDVQAARRLYVQAARRLDLQAARSARAQVMQHGAIENTVGKEMYLKLICGSEKCSMKNPGMSSFD